MRRIVLLVSSMAAGGAERVAATLANAWVAMGREVILVPTYLSCMSSAYETHSSVAIQPLSEFVSRRMQRIAGRGAKLLALRKLVRALAPDVVVSFLTNVNVMAVIALAGLDCRLVLSERVDVAARVELSRGLRAARAALYQLADALVVQTSAAARGYRRSVISVPQTVVIPNPIPAPLYGSSLRAQQNAEGGKIVAMGRLTPQKQFDQLIQAFAKAFRGDTAWTLTIWGEGPLRAYLERQIAELGIGDLVRLAGMTRSPWAELAAAQIFVLSSAYEGFPNAMLEAMALGLPCVAYDCPSGPRELATDGRAAVLVAPTDIDRLSAELRSLADDPARRARLGQIAADSVRQRFGEARVLSQWETLFSRVCVDADIR